MSDKPIMPMTCLLCDEPAAVVVKADEGCTCAGNVYQPRCFHHLRRLRDSDAGCFEVVEDFRVGEWRNL